MFCFGLNFLNQCSKSQLTEHFLFNFETAISSLAIVVSLYALFLERRFRVRVEIKRDQLNLLLVFAGSVLFFTFIGSILPYLPGEALPLLGYPAFWEIIASVILFFSIMISCKLTRRIKRLTKKQIKRLCSYAPHSTIKYNGEIDLMLRESEYFWPDFLEKSIGDERLKEVLNIYFSEKDFLKLVAKSYYIIVSTVNFVADLKHAGHKDHVERFLKLIIAVSISEEESILNDDLNSSFKELTQYIFREKGLAGKIFDNSFVFDEILLTNETSLKIYLRMLSILELYLGRKYHYTENVSHCVGKIDSKVLKNIFDFFDSNIYRLESNNLEKFLDSFSDIHVDMEGLSDENSVVLANKTYKLLERSVNTLRSIKDKYIARHIVGDIYRHFILVNDKTKETFDEKLLEKIIGTKNKKSENYNTSNLDGYYPMMIPIYFYIYGYELFANKGEKILPENMNMHLIILKKMQKKLPMISSGRMQEYLNIPLPKDDRGKEIIKKREEECLLAMFPDNIFYNRELNTITYIFGNEEASETILLNETSLENVIVYKK